MAQAFTNVRFVGGVLDGKRFIDQPSIMLRAIHKEFTGIWTALQPDGQIAIFKSHRLGQNWHQLNQHIYHKGEKDKDGFIVYSYAESKVITRCAGIIKKGGRCDTFAKEGMRHCTVHERIYGNE